MVGNSKTQSARLFYYAAILLPVCFFSAVFYFNAWAIVSSQEFVRSPLQWIFVAFVVCSLLIHYSVSMVGILFFGVPRLQNSRNVEALQVQGWDKSKTLVFCFASQGSNEGVLRDSVRQALNVARLYDIPAVVELVVEVEPADPFFRANGCHVIKVPAAFETPHGSRFKARALHYACEVRKSRHTSLDRVWILHCDEETLVTEQCLAGIHKFLQSPGSERKCGAGEIKYNALSYGLGNMFGLIDSHRTGEDLGRFRFQYKVFKAALFGAHGSFLVIPALVEQQIQFDFGPEGSITEDVYFAFKARELGIPFVWLEGYVREQSPISVKDFFKQRARWIHGLLNVCFDRKFSAKHRIILLSYLAMWRTTIFAGIILLFFITTLPGYPFITGLWLLDLAVIGTILLVGGMRNLEEDQHRSAVEKFLIATALFLLSPLICLMETLAVVYGVFSKRGEFYVVDKIPSREIVTACK